MRKPWNFFPLNSHCNRSCGCLYYHDVYNSRERDLESFICCLHSLVDLLARIAWPRFKIPHDHLLNVQSRAVCHMTGKLFLDLRNSGSFYLIQLLYLFQINNLIMYTSTIHQIEKLSKNIATIPPICSTVVSIFQLVWNSLKSDYINSTGALSIQTIDSGFCNLIWSHPSRHCSLHLGDVMPCHGVLPAVQSISCHPCLNSSMLCCWNSRFLVVGVLLTFVGCPCPF